MAATLRMSARHWVGVALAALGAGRLALAAPASAVADVGLDQSITAVSATQIASFTPYSFYASAGYCDASVTKTWTCGANCQANPGFKVVAAGGNGFDVQFWFVGYDPALDTVIVSHQGTDPGEMCVQLHLPLITDADFFLASLDATLFPGISSSIEVHSGFAESHADTATSVLQAVQQTMNTHGTNSVVTTGHSLGAAIALLDAVYLHMHLPASARISFVGYGLPRVGNQAFANFVDALAPAVSVTHINNREDIVPILPGRFLGFAHTSGELHIQDSGGWVACPGQDNESDECIVGDVPNIFEGDEGDHDGPYNGVTMGC
ncbi:alpha/beta-hydrolase [Trametes cingulata]|nr:alpha/beta-hydrolase [Trametes cingulata]